MTTPQIGPYTPALYQPDAYGRYRQYPRVVTAAIPGVGYDVDRLVWAEQELNLDGGRATQNYGNYRMVPLRGLGQLQVAISPTLAASTRPWTSLIQSGGITYSPPPPPPAYSETQESSGPGITETPPESEIAAAEEEAFYDVAAEIERAASAAQAEAEMAEPEGGFLTSKVGPVPVWVLLLGSVAVVGGGAWWYTRKR